MDPSKPSSGGLPKATSYGRGSLLVAVFWCLGFQLLRWLNKRNYLARYVEQEGTISIHGFLARQYGNSRLLARLAALASMVGLAGTAFFEAEFTGQVVASATKNGQSTAITLMFLFVIVALVYIVIGGFRAVVATDRIQLKLGFVAFSLFAAMCYIKAVTNGYMVTAFILSLLSLLSVSLLVFLRFGLHKHTPNVFPKGYEGVLLISLVVFFIGLMAVLLIALFGGLPCKDSLSVFFHDQKVFSPLSLGVVPLIGLLLANSLWQVVDISSWQRLSSLETTPESRRELNRTLSFISLYSPITWALAIFVGMSLRYVGFELSEWTPIQGIAAASFSSPSLFDNLHILVFLFAMISIMYSTLDSLISSISYTCYYDMLLGGNLDEKAQLSRARILTVACTILLLAGYIAVRYRVANPDEILYTFYAFQLALFPSIFWALVGKSVNKLSAIVSILGGSALCVTTLVFKTSVYNPYSYAAIVTVIGGTVLYALFTLFRRFEVRHV